MPPEITLPVSNRLLTQDKSTTGIANSGWRNRTYETNGCLRARQGRPQKDAY